MSVSIHIKLAHHLQRKLMYTILNLTNVHSIRQTSNVPLLQPRARTRTPKCATSARPRTRKSATNHVAAQPEVGAPNPPRSAEPWRARTAWTRLIRRRSFRPCPKRTRICSLAMVAAPEVIGRRPRRRTVRVCRRGTACSIVPVYRMPMRAGVWLY